MSESPGGDRQGDAASDDADQDALERDAIEVQVEEFFRRRRGGDRCSVDDFADRLPGREAEFRQLVATLDLLESAAAAVLPGRADAAAPARIGRFRLLRAIGRGGMGTVYEAHDDVQDQLVALKVLPHAETLGPRAIERFRREADAAARLRHPHIVPLLGVGEDDGCHWIAMQLVDGTSMDAAMARGAARMEPREVARHGLALAEALQCAHSAGILHRDVKPSNVLIDRSGCAFVTDFGLASFEGAVAITRPGESLGTPRYMAPEAFAGWADPRTDLWGVGVTLYELLAGRPPFDGQNRAELQAQILGSDPPPLRRIDPTLPRALVTLVERCLQKEPSARYASAQALADDLRRFLAGQPIHARPPTPLDRLVALAKRHRTAATLSTLALLAFVALLLGWVVTLDRTNDHLLREQGRAEENLAVASDAIERVLDEATADLVLRAPALDPLRRRILEAALDFEQRLLANQSESGAKRFDVAMAHLRIGAIDWSLQRLPESRANYAAAAAVLRDLASSATREGGSELVGVPAERIAMQLAAALSGLACCARDEGDLAGAEAALVEALARIDTAIGRASADGDHAHHLLDATTLLADLLARQQRAGDGATRLLATLLRVEPWLARADAEVQNLRVLRDGCAQLAEAQFQAGDAAAAIAALRRALEASARVLAADDANVRDQAIDAARRSWLGALLQASGSAAEGRLQLATARADLEAIAARWPMVPEFRCGLAETLTRAVLAEPRTAAVAATEPLLERAIELADGALVERPGEASFLAAALRARNALTMLLDDRGAADAAWLVAEASTAQVEAHRASLRAGSATLIEQAAAAWHDRGIVAQKRQQLDTAAASFTRAQELLAPLPGARDVEPAARNLRWRIALASGALDAERGALDAALATFATLEEEARRALAGCDLATAARAGDGAPAELAALLIEALNRDAITRARRRDPPDRSGARARLAEAIALGESLVANWPGRADFAGALGMAHGDHGMVALLDGDAPRARAACLRALPLLQRAIAADPRLLAWRAALAVALDWYAAALEPLRQASERDPLAADLATVAAAADEALADPDVQWEAARVFARAASVAHGSLATRFGAPARDPFADAAMERLRRASAAGFRDAARFDGDIAFDALRRRDDFVAWLADLDSDRR